MSRFAPAPLPRLLAVLISAGALAIGLGACGNKHARPTTANNNQSGGYGNTGSSQPTGADANNNGAYLWAGNVTYQLQVSRELNPYSASDSAYLAGVDATALTASQEWYAVFLWAKNQTSSPQTTADSFDIVDTEGNYYYPVALNPKVNLFAWTKQTLSPQATEPQIGTVPYYTPPQGSELLFKINETAYANRPLTLQIHAAGQRAPSTISLDL